MGDLRLIAIGIDQVRDIFGADAELAARLRAVVSRQFTAPLMANRPKQSLIARLGPMLRRPIDPPTIPLDQPLNYDAENLLAGRYITPGRLGQAWQIVEAWLVDLAWGSARLEVDPEQISTIEFALACAGLPSQFGVLNLMALDPQIPLRPESGSSIGYAKYDHVIATTAELLKALPLLEGVDPQTLKPLLVFLREFPDWGASADQTGRRRPDLFVIWRR